MDLPTQRSTLELEQEAAESLAAFVRARVSEGAAPYRQAFEAARPRVQELFRATDNLRALTGATIAESPELIDAARFVCGPPLSQDDIATLAGGKLSGRRHIDQELADRAVEALRAFVDPFRCGWLRSGREPSARAIRAAINWTASLWAVEQCRTRRRTVSSAAQEKSVADLLGRCGLVEDPSLSRFRALDDLQRGHFTREVVLGRAKADFVARLDDGRLLALECKVSNSAVNSVKRLNRETVGKAERWRRRFGDQVITGAVLAGVFKVSNLVDAQEAGVFIFWDHDLKPLDEFVRRAATPEDAR